MNNETYEIEKVKINNNLEDLMGDLHRSMLGNIIRASDLGLSLDSIIKMNAMITGINTTIWALAMLSMTEDETNIAFFKAQFEKEVTIVFKVMSDIREQCLSIKKEQNVSKH